MLRYLLILPLLVPSLVHASSISLDIGQSKTSYNRFSIPNSSSDRIDLPQGDTITTRRITAYVDLGDNRQLYILLAPLSLEYTFVAEKDFTFDGVNYANGTQTRVNYTFNSYRLGYLKTWNAARATWWIGATGKIRDAEIAVIQGTTTQAYDNVGLVPLLSLGFDWLFYFDLSLFTHIDAMEASQGSAYDAQLELKQQFRQFSWSIGKRILGGGVDNDKVYNFASFDTYYLKVAVYF